MSDNVGDEAVVVLASLKGGRSKDGTLVGDCDVPTLITAGSPPAI